MLTCRVAELELMRGREHGEQGKLERLEACTASLLEGMQLERDNVSLSTMYCGALYIVSQ